MRVTQEANNIQDYKVPVNAIAVIDTTARFFDLKTLGLTENQIRQYTEFRISAINSHNQPATISLRSELKALGSHSSAGQMYNEANNIAATTGRLMLSAGTGGAGADSAFKNVPALRGSFSNLWIGVSFAVAPTSGSITIGVEMFG